MFGKKTTNDDEYDNLLRQLEDEENHSQLQTKGYSEKMVSLVNAMNKRLFLAEMRTQE